MSPAAGLGHVWIVGPGRVGRALGRKLTDCSAATSVSFVGRALDQDSSSDRASPAAGPPISVYSWGRLPPDPPSLILITVRDDSIAEVGSTLASLALPATVALHTSGVLDSDALRPLAAAGWATGSMPPIASIADPDADADRLVGAWWAIEGSPLAVAAAERVVQALDGRPLYLRSDGKTAYHTAAVFASNFLTAIMEVAEGLMQEAGVEPAESRPVLSRLAQGTLANIEQRGPEAALSGPIGRGDVETVRRHLDRLSGRDRRLYSVLASRTLEIAKRRGLDPEAARQIEELLEESES